MKTTHVVVGDLPRGLMKMALSMSNRVDAAVAFPDDLTFGPLGNVLDDGTVNARRRWWGEILPPAEQHHAAVIGEDWMNFRLWLLSLQPSDAIVVWVADNVAERMGGLCVLAHLPPTVSVSLVNVSQSLTCLAQPSTRGPIKGTGEIEPEDLIPMMGQAVILDSSRRQRAIALWIRLNGENGRLRQVVDGHLQTVAEDYFDAYIVEQMRAQWNREEYVNSARLVGECLGYHPQITYSQDYLVFWRIRRLIQAGIFTFTGSMNSMRECRIRLA